MTRLGIGELLACLSEAIVSRRMRAINGAGHGDEGSKVNLGRAMIMPATSRAGNTRAQLSLSPMRRQELNTMSGLSRLTSCVTGALSALEVRLAAP